MASPTDLARLQPRLALMPGFRQVGEELECLDPNGMMLRFVVSRQQAVEVPVTPINQWGDVRRIDQPSPVYSQAQPINIGHVVFFVEDLAATERFYRELLDFGFPIAISIAPSSCAPGRAAAAITCSC